MQRAIYPTCEIHISPRGESRKRREETSLSGPHRILFDWALHARPLIACDWWRKALEETLNLQCIVGSWPMPTKSCLCLVAVFFFLSLRGRWWRWREGYRHIWGLCVLWMCEMGEEEEEEEEEEQTLLWQEHSIRSRAAIKRIQAQKKNKIIMIWTRCQTERFQRFVSPAPSRFNHSALMSRAGVHFQGGRKGIVCVCVWGVRAPRRYKLALPLTLLSVYFYFFLFKGKIQEGNNISAHRPPC